MSCYYKAKSADQEKFLYHDKKTHLAETESEMSGSSCSTTRGSSGRGRGGRGGFVPKKEVLEAMRARSSLSDETSKKTISEADISRVLEQSLNESAESSKDKKRDGSDIVDFSDDENIRGCDLCCDPDHRARFCPIFNKPKPVEPVLACYYCKKPGHIKSECPKKQRSDFNVSRNFGNSGQNQNRNFSENLTGSGNRYGANSQNQRSNNWSVIRAGSNFKGANFVSVPMPVAASSVKPAIELRPSFLPSTDVVGKNLAPELPPKSKIVFNRSDSEDYESDDDKEQVANKKTEEEEKLLLAKSASTGEENPTYDSFNPPAINPDPTEKADDPSEVPVEELMDNVAGQDYYEILLSGSDGDLSSSNASNGEASMHSDTLDGAPFIDGDEEDDDVTSADGDAATLSETVLAEHKDREGHAIESITNYSEFADLLNEPDRIAFSGCSQSVEDSREASMNEEEKDENT
uniref:CCHC-type domain-containing protein n=1 Tax=Ditylenchus dipsaci TaxID=166011 RepID=A0A915EMF7_9BILA